MATQEGKHHPRRLQVFSLDPGAAERMDSAMISRCVLGIEWEDVSPGPIGNYLEVIDYDPASGCGYDPVNLGSLLATDGLSPSIGNPQFHQQMVYAVVMHTIKNFERVLGRRVTWAERRKDPSGEYLFNLKERFVPRLRIYPHALRQQNAFYSPTKRALLFGYFNAPTADPRLELPGGLVFTCLSHDIIVHETTHAILDGIHPRLLDASNDDMLAFHEAFADVVAIFQHFTLPGLLLDQVQKTRGELARNNLLVQLASQFARSTNMGDALRNALGKFDENGNRERPDPSEFCCTKEPHARGAILVAAIFDAFLRIYEDRVADLRRIATRGSGILPEGDIHPDLARRFADEAVKAAGRVLTICIRAIDYLPPVDITFGDYLRALITADADLAPEDPHHYRLAFIESFRERGIYPIDVRTLSEESLRWSHLSDGESALVQDFLPWPSMFQAMAYSFDASAVADETVLVSKEYTQSSENLILQLLNRREFDKAAAEFFKRICPASSDNKVDTASQAPISRFLLDKLFCMIVNRWIVNMAAEKLSDQNVRDLQWTLGLDLAQLAQGGRLEVHAVRPTRRVRPDGRTRTELLVSLTQRIRVPLVDEDGIVIKDANGQPCSFKHRGGCTLIIDPDNGQVEYAIGKYVSSERRIDRHAAFLRDHVEKKGQEAVTRFGLTDDAARKRLQMEPFALVHTHASSREGLY